MRHSLLGCLLALYLLAGSAALSAFAPATSEAGAAAGRPLARQELQALLQSFADRAYRKGFRELGVERDFDHGHLLYAAGSQRPFAVLYHTQERVAAPRGGLLDPDGRNWLQWLDGGRIEDARRYARKIYPETAYGRWFRAREVPRFQRRRTVAPEMLDPERLGAEISFSRQWEFAVVPCAPSGDSASRLEVRLPGRARVCLETFLR